MRSVATIIAGEDFNLNEQELNEIIDALSHNGAIVENVEWLAKNKAADIHVAVLATDDIRYLLTELLAPLPIDFIVQSPEGRRKKLLICDMDSTIIEQECIDELADCLGIKPQIAAITEKAMNGELDFKAALRERVALLKGLGEDKLQLVYDTRITYTKGAVSLVKTMKEQSGARAILVSGGFTFFTSRVRAHTGFDVDESNLLEIKDRALTGKVIEPILDSQSKLNALHFHCEEAGTTPFMAAAVGDGANDLPMIKAAGLGIAFCAKPNVVKQATHKVDIRDLRHVLYAQGYKDSEILE